MKRVTCFPDSVLGKILPQHGICNYPQDISTCEGAADTEECARINAMFRYIAPPVSRMKYACNTAYGKYLDIPFIFRDFRKDPDDPANYLFTVTDPIITRWQTTTAGTGGKLMYRLGALREYYAPLYSRVPEDFDAFADVCLHIVRHLNDGWADGLHAGIEYWEIWNRADDRCCWAGTAEEYYRLYDVTARRLKAAYPALKVGGPAAAYCGGDNAFLRGFLEYVRSNSVPCDFVSWNYFGLDPAEAGRQARTVKAMVLETLGSSVEVINDEWNAVTEKENGMMDGLHARDAQGGAFCGAFMTEMHKAGMDFSTYYDCTANSPWGALYELAGLHAFKSMYSLLAFASVYKQENELETKVSGKNVYALAAQKDGSFAVMVSVYEDRCSKLELNLPFAGKKRIRVLDKDKDLETVLETEDETVTLNLHGYSLILAEGGNPA